MVGLVEAGPPWVVSLRRETFRRDSCPPLVGHMPPPPCHPLIGVHGLQEEKVRISIEASLLVLNGEVVRLQGQVAAGELGISLTRRGAIAGAGLARWLKIRMSSM